MGESRLAGSYVVIIIVLENRKEVKIDERSRLGITMGEGGWPDRMS